MKEKREDRMAAFAFRCFPKRIDIPVALRDQPFDACQTSARLADALRRSGIRVLGDLQGRKVGDFAWQRNCGFNTLHELDSLVAAFNLWQRTRLVWKMELIAVAPPTAP